jgi:predicted  nucleic acid-binding Zn-ribbon protein
MSLPPSKEIAQELAEGGKGVLRFIPRVMTIMDTLERLTKAIDKQAGQIEALRERLDRLEAREEILLAKIDAAAARATADMAGRLGRVEGILQERNRRD